MKFRRRPIESLPVSSASMSDIVFSLLLFFMVSTVIKKYSGLPVQVPAAFNIEKLSTKTHTSYLWIDKQQRIVFDDYPINSMEELYSVARA
ncbi:MAG TPA: biopolymer transporter ExbD, partial [bacterium]|nr:biopolymer transporter ExbD [bacterium]